MLDEGIHDTHTHTFDAGGSTVSMAWNMKLFVFRLC